MPPSPLSSPAPAPHVDPSPPGLPPHRLQEIAPGHPQRAEAEAFVRRIYRARYGAEVRHFAPHLVALRGAAGEIAAAAGYRPAGRGPLFLERYLDGPVEALLARAGGMRAPRERIAEVGHLAASRAGEGRRLIELLGPHLACRGFQWVACTSTQALRHLFVRLGIAPLALGVADPAALGEEAADWGRYYQHQPIVIAGPLEPALRLLARRQGRA